MSDDEGALETPATSRRARRATKKVNYAKEQEFSDASDIFDESDGSAPKSKKRGRGRRSDAGDLARDDDLLKKSAPVYTERGYDPSLPPIRERFPFLPEYEPDGSPRLDLIVGRRPIDEKEDSQGNENEDGEDEKKDDNDMSDDEDGGQRSRKPRRGSLKNKKGSPSKAKDSSAVVEYEYLIKYKGRSYLHLEWKSGADLESMNKSAKGMYRRYLKKIGAGDEELEDPNFDPSYAVPQLILDEAKQEMQVDLTDKELLKWEKQRAKELAEEEDSDDQDKNKKDDKREEVTKKENTATIEETEQNVGEGDTKKEELEDWEDEDIDFKTLSIDRLRKLVNADGPYYPVFEGCDNPYRDGYITEPPKKPRASYLFFQCAMRSYIKKRNPNASQGELMTILGETWGAMGVEEQAPFIRLAREEQQQHERERALMEKAQKPNEVWQPLRRCQMVVNRLKSDPFVQVFMEPVDLNDFPDYEEAIDTPMDLGTVETKLKTRKYMAPEQFARDVRKIWNNCKIYNQHGSAIWHVADYMSKQFERLYHAWVLDFRERYLRWANPKARPWEQTCRQCDGKCNTPDDQLVVCDHCDAPYGFKCVQPPLKKLPKGVWHCVDCKPRIKSVKGIRMLSAVAEHAARKRAELGDTPKKTINQTMYLVKWKGLGYEYCTWETKDDIGNPELIAEFHRLNNTYPDEPDMPEAVVNKLLTSMRHVNLDNAGGTSCVPDLRTQLYAQTRALQFSKFGMELPESLCSSCGPKTKAATVCKIQLETINNEKMGPNQSEGDERTPSGFVVSGQSEGADGEVKPDNEKKSSSDEDISMDQAMIKSSLEATAPSTPAKQKKPEGISSHPREVLECLSGLVDLVSKQDAIKIQGRINARLPPLLTGEYDAIIPITSKGLMMNVGEIQGSVAFLGYRSFPDGSKGPSELNNLVRNVGDKIIAVDGVSTIKKSFQEVIGMLKESGKNKYAFMRFLETRFSVCDSELSSVGATGRYAIAELQKRFSTDRERLLLQRKKQLVEATTENQEEAEESDGSAEADSGEESEEDSEGEFQPDSDAEADELMEKRIAVKKLRIADSTPPSKDEESPGGDAESNALAEKAHHNGEDGDGGAYPAIGLRHETTRSLAFRLLDVDIGNSSDEGGDDDCVFYLDGMDETFTTMETAKEFAKVDKDEKKPEKRKSLTEKKPKEPESTVPVKRNEYSELGERAQLAASVLLAKQTPKEDDFENFPYSKEAELQESAEAGEEDGSPVKSTKRSTVKIEQIDTSTNEIVHIWANAQSAAATLQLRVNDLKRVLEGEYDIELGDEVGGFRWRYALAGAKVTAGLETTGRGKKGREAWLEFRDKLYDPTEPHMYKNNNKLRTYQVDGVNFLAGTYYKRHSCILADEMGLGKTVQIVCYIEHLYRVEKIKKPYLVVVPLSTVEHWRREFEGWTDMVCCIYHDRQRVWRDVLREYEWYYKDRPHTADFLKFDVLVTTYDTLIGDFDAISQIPFRVAVVDEAHRLRNQKGKLLECMREISAKGTLQYGFQSRVLMSGTPLQNDLNELWTLLNFIEPFKFPDLEDFQMRFGNMANREQVESLQQMISPYMLRRIKEDVATDIPSKEETVIDVELTSIQKQYYRAIFEHNHAFLSIGATRTNAPKLMNIQMELRKVCNHPFLLEGVEHRISEQNFKDMLESGKFENTTPEEQHRMILEQGMIMSSGKMVLLDKLLPKLRAEGHKILIFSQMVKMLDFISEYCEFRSFPFERLDGRVRGTERQKSIDRFENDPNSFLFLLSTRAGGVGINLTAADICIIFDSDWNPQNDVQAQARCHRIGQTKDVKIFRLITSKTFEAEMFEKASKKLGLEQAVLGTFDQDKDDDKPTNQEMEQLLKKGAYALLEDEENEAGNAFCADDIENILAKRTRTRVVEGAKTASWLNKQGMVVSKSKFTSEAGDSKLDMDDPMFWQKVMPDFVTPSIMEKKLEELCTTILGTPKKGPGRGHGRWKKKREEEAKAAAEAAEAARANRERDGTNGGETPAPNGLENGIAEGKEENGTDTAGGSEPKQEDASEEPKQQEEDNDDEGDGDDDDDESEEEEKTKKLSKTSLRKVAKFMSDLKSCMESVIDDAEEDTLPAIEKTTCQRLLLQISINERLFNEQQRHYARTTLKRLEGDRRRRCRTSDQPRFTPGRSRGSDDIGADNLIPEELRIERTKKVRRKRRKKWEIEAERAEKEARKRRRLESDDEDGDVYVGADGYLHHSDSEADWSDFEGGGKKNFISRKEAKRRRQWAADDDSTTAAGRLWPVFPRHLVSMVLKTVLNEVMRYDESRGGVFSVPVPKDEFPEYYEQIKKPMDYGTMSEKLQRGEYRSAQAMQKDFILVMQNCVQFNSPNSDIVKDARQQALMRPSILRKAAARHNLFLAEDGSVLEIIDEPEKGEKKKRRKKKAGADEVSPQKRKSKKKMATENADEEEAPKSPIKNKPRIQISLSGKKGKSRGDGDEDPTRKKVIKRKRRKRSVEGYGVEDASSEMATPIPRRKKKRGNSSTMPHREDEDSDDDIPIKAMKAEASKNKPEEKVDTQGNPIFLDVSYWKEQREKLDGSFMAARALYTKHGPWELPPELSSDKRFRMIAKSVIAKMDRHDGYSVFADAVSDSEAPGYSDVITHPMHFTLMREKIEKKEYGTGAQAFQLLYEDFLLLFDNCYAYNPAGGEVVQEAARIFGYIGESFAASATAVMKKMKMK